MRFPAEVSLIVLTAAVILGFGRLFRDTSYLGPVLLMAVASHLLAIWLRRRRVPVGAAGAASVAAMVIVGAWVFYAATTRYGLPTGLTWQTFTADLGEAVERFREDKAPTEAVTGFVAASAVGFWLVAFLADWSAFRLWAPFEATVPAGSLFVFASLLGADSGRGMATALFFLAAVGFLLFHRVARQETGPNWVRGDGSAGARALAATGTSIAVVALVIGALVGPVLPGARSQPIFDVTDIGNSGSGTRVTVSPLVDIRERLVDQRETEVFTVRASQRAYWRLTALDDFDGRVWRSSKRFERTTGTNLRSQAVNRAPVEEIEQRYTIRNLSQIWLPAAFRPVRIDAPARNVRWEDTTTTLIVDRATSNDMTYRVTSSVPKHRPELLRSSSDYVPPHIADQYLALPDGLDPRVGQLAEQITAEADGFYDKALALQQYFRQYYTYSTEVTGGHDIDRIDEFLFSDVRSGYCEQFAGAFAALARTLGIPARVAVGFTPGDPDPADPNLYRVRGRHAHAWPEVFIEGFNWVLFEPTPGRGAPGAESYTAAVEQQDSDVLPGGPQDEGTTTAPTDLPDVPFLDDIDPGLFPELGEFAPTVPDTSAPAPVQAVRDRGPSALAVAGALALGYVVLVPGGRRVWRWRRQRSASTPNRKVEAAWEDTVAALGLLGLRPRPEDTPTEFAARAGGRIELPAELAELARITTGARYSGGEVDPDSAGRAEEAARVVTAAVRDRSGRGERLRAELDPRPALRSVKARLRPRRSASDDGQRPEPPRTLVSSGTSGPGRRR